MPTCFASSAAASSPTPGPLPERSPPAVSTAPLCWCRTTPTPAGFIGPVVTPPAQRLLLDRPAVPGRPDVAQEPAAQTAAVQLLIRCTLGAGCTRRPSDVLPLRFVRLVVGRPQLPADPGRLPRPARTGVRERRRDLVSQLPSDARHRRGRQRRPLRRGDRQRQSLGHAGRPPGRRQKRRQAGTRTTYWSVGPVAEGAWAAPSFEGAMALTSPSQMARSRCPGRLPPRRPSSRSPKFVMQARYRRGGGICGRRRPLKPAKLLPAR